MKHSKKFTEKNSPLYQLSNALLY